MKLGKGNDRGFNFLTILFDFLGKLCQHFIGKNIKDIFNNFLPTFGIAASAHNMVKNHKNVSIFYVLAFYAVGSSSARGIRLLLRTCQVFELAICLGSSFLCMIAKLSQITHGEVPGLVRLMAHKN